MTDLLARLQTALGPTYRVERELSGGGMSRVFLARERELERQVVVKVLPPEMAAGVNAERFRREIQLAASLQHPHIVPLLAAGHADDLVYYTMPLIEGESLRAKLAHQGELPIAEAVRILRDVADALAYAHAHGVAHRDIKPDNVLITNHHAVVTDFGVAKALSESSGKSSLTSAGVALGTPAYMAPEQAAADPHTDHRCDIYAVGALAYEMLTGRPPFTGATHQQVLAAQVTEAPEPVSKRRSAVPAALAALVMRCLQKSPADRWQSAAELVRQLEAMATPSGGLTPTGTTAAERGSRAAWRRWPVYAGIAGLVLIAAFGAFAHLHTRSATTPAARKMLVVLPFENLGRSEDEYFADGMTEEVTARLAGLRGLGVIGRTSAIQYKKTTKSIAQIGQELGVDYVLEGTVRWQKAPHGASRVRVTPQLVRVSDASHVWAKVYDAVLADVFDVQSNIAAQVAETLNVALLAPERQALAVRPTENLEAYDYYLRGTVYDARQYVAEDARLAVRMYQRAVELDSGFVLAYTGLVQNHVFLSWLFGETGELPKAEAALDRARRLAPDLPETHLALGLYYYHGKRDYENALKEFAWVRERQPNNPDAISATGFIHRRQGRWPETLREVTRAIELDPRDDGIIFELGLTYALLHRYAEAERAVRRAASLAPDIPAYYGLLVSLYVLEGDPAGAKRILAQAPSTLDPGRIIADGVADLDRPRVRVLGADYRDALTRLPLPLSGRDSANHYLLKAEFSDVRGDLAAAHLYYDSARVALERTLAARPRNRASEQRPREMVLALAYAGLGRKADAIRVGRAGAQIVPVSRDALAGTIVLQDLIEVYIRTGEHDAALEQLEYLLSIPSLVSSGLLRIDPLYAPLRGDPRFERLAREGK